MGQAISKLTIKGYKSIRNLENFELRNLNILIGPNGGGKSNFIEFFSFLRAISKGRSQYFVTHQGGADRILYLGSKITKELVGSITSSGILSWEFKLFPSKVDELLFYEEEVTGGSSSLSTKWAREFEHGFHESTLFSKGNAEHDKYVEKIRNRIQPVIESWVVYHFHDTSDLAGVKKPCSKRDYEYLRSDASNLTAFLLRLKKKHQRDYAAIREVIQLAAPFFDDFLLREEEDEDKDDVLLEWRQKGSDYPFHPSQISDGTLRFICLATALLQPNPPSTILLDEPELGLHPYALAILAGLIQKASYRAQVIVSTQSAALIDHFQPEDIILVERKNDESVFSRPDTEKLKIWLEDYSLGDIWSRNIIEGTAGQ
jgi:predicted ATPase